MPKIINNFIKTIIIVTSLVISGDVFAQVQNPVTNLTLTQRQLTGSLVPGIAGFEVKLILVGVNESNNAPYQTPFSFVNGSQVAVNFSFDIPVNNTVLNNGLRLNTGNDTYLFNRIDITLTDTTLGVESSVIQSFNLVDIIQGAVENSVSIDFPGWQNLAAADTFVVVPNGGGKYYPVIKSNRTANGDISIVRTPSNTTLYLMIENINSSGADQVQLLETIESNGSGKFNINFPKNCTQGSCTLPITARLDSGGSYAIFLSDLYIPDAAPGQTYFRRVNTRGSQSSYQILPIVPGTSPVTVPDPATSNANTLANETAQNPNTMDINVASSFTPQQQRIINDGIAPIDCGYNLSDGGKLCGFSELITLIQNVIEYIFILVIPITAIVFAYAGYLYLTSGGSLKKRKKAKNAMTSVLIGIVIVMCAWLLVTLIVRTLGASPETTQFLDI
jgi:hypothetical protein